MGTGPMGYAPVVNVHERLIAHEQRAHDLQRRYLQREVERLRAHALPKNTELRLLNAKSGMRHKLADDAHACKLS